VRELANHIKNECMSENNPEREHPCPFRNKGCGFVGNKE